MLEDYSKTKTKALSVYENSIFFIMYDVRTNNLGKLPDSDVCNVSNFWPETKVVVEL